MPVMALTMVLDILPLQPVDTVVHPVLSSNSRATRLQAPVVTMLQDSPFNKLHKVQARILDLPPALPSLVP